MENATSNGVHIFFHWYDHAFFAFMLTLSIAVGVYFSISSGRKKDTSNEYFLGNREMSVLPITVSLVASHISSISLISVPADVYSFGAMYWLSVISIFFCAFATSFVYLPVFYELQLNSIYEYLNMRFDASVRTICSSFFIFQGLLLMSIIVYIPALAYAHSTGIPINYVLPVICGICIFYTSIGGLKTVVCTDTLQFLLTCVAVMIIFYLGLSKAGGLGNVFATAWKGARLELNFDWDPTKRETVFAVLIYWFLSYTRMLSTNQECVLKFLSLPTLRKAQKSIFLFCFGIIIVKSIIVITGLIMFTLYKNCDPETAGLVQKTDQLVPFYVADVASKIPGLAGMFLSGVTCTALSALSVMMNALSATIYQDFVTKYVPSLVTEKNAGITMKLLVVVVGIVITFSGMFVGNLGPILPLTISLASFNAGSSLGLFTLGVLVPKANTKGAIAGLIVSTFVVGWMVIGAQWYKSKNLIKYIPTNLSIDHCPFNVTAYAPNSTIADEPVEIFYAYRISHYYYALIGGIICIVVGFITSCLTESEGPIDRRLLSPIVHPFLKAETKDAEYFTLDKANRIVTLVDLKSLEAQSPQQTGMVTRIIEES